MREVGSKNKQFAGCELGGLPLGLVLGDPGGGDAICGSVDGDGEEMRAGHDFETAVGHVRGVDGEEDGEVFYVFDVRVSCAVEVGREAAGAGELVVYCPSTSMPLAFLVLIPCR
jgi:hypothetical protein